MVFSIQSRRDAVDHGNDATRAGGTHGKRPFGWRTVRDGAREARSCRRFYKELKPQQTGFRRITHLSCSASQPAVSRRRVRDRQVLRVSPRRAWHSLPGIVGMKAGGGEGHEPALGVAEGRRDVPLLQSSQGLGGSIIAVQEPFGDLEPVPVDGRLPGG